MLRTLIILALCASSLNAHAAMRFYVASMPLLDIDTPDKDFNTRFAVGRSRFVPGSRITNVIYQWHYPNAPRNISVELCHGSGHCIDATHASRRVTSEFSGLDPAQPFHFRVRVLGQKSFHPLVGGGAGINVNFYEPPPER